MVTNQKIIICDCAVSNRILITFVLNKSWLPFFIYNVITGIFKANLSKSHEFIYSIFTWFGYMNSGCNPIIYAFSSRDFRRAFTKILCPARFWRKKTKLIGSSNTTKSKFKLKINYLLIKKTDV